MGSAPRGDELSLEHAIPMETLGIKTDVQPEAWTRKDGRRIMRKPIRPPIYKSGQMEDVTRGDRPWGWWTVDVIDIPRLAMPLFCLPYNLNCENIRNISI